MSMDNPDIRNPDIAAAFGKLPAKAQEPLQTIRRWIFDIANMRDDVGTLHEELKWGANPVMQPAPPKPVARYGWACPKMAKLARFMCHARPN